PFLNHYDAGSFARRGRRQITVRSPTVARELNHLSCHMTSRWMLCVNRAEFSRPGLAVSTRPTHSFDSSGLLSTGLSEKHEWRSLLFCRLDLKDPPLPRLCKKFVVRPSGGSLYLGFRLITNFRLKAELRTSCFYTVSALVGFGRRIAAPVCRLSMNDPPTALVGFGTGAREFLCRMSMNDPPTALVGFGTC